jgi:hypothetical protein
VFEKEDIILGIEGTDIIVNHCILIAKYVIYRCRYNNRTPTFAAIKAYLRYIKQIEKNISYTNNNEAKFLGKWSALFRVLA